MDRSVGIDEEFRWRTQNESDELVSEIEIPRVAFSEGGFEPPVIGGWSLFVLSVRTCRVFREKEGRKEVSEKDFTSRMNIRRSKLIRGDAGREKKGQAREFVLLSTTTSECMHLPLSLRLLPQERGENANKATSKRPKLRGRFDYSARFPRILFHSNSEDRSNYFHGQRPSQAGRNNKKIRRHELWQYLPADAATNVKLREIFAFVKVPLLRGGIPRRNPSDVMTLPSPPRRRGISVEKKKNSRVEIQKKNLHDERQCQDVARNISSERKQTA
ncbi:hypothetical protein WN51_13909 [Melipona quadrifasciata]|uniref:Uncharacterized protein n=1 Tax=Melipona quadrifasciata TaxID=166423 RepID=A0A0N0BFU4_9HYME|nr:hypothetical protein WN51_13909 [Melipona quadrifasciata]